MGIDGEEATLYTTRSFNDGFFVVWMRRESKSEEAIMDREEILAFLNKNQVCHLATIDGDKPRVRAMMMYRADDDGILFHTARMKDLSKQLEANPLVEVCFNNIKDGVQVRVSGSVEFVDDQDLKEEIVAARSFLKPWVDELGYEMLAVFRVSNCIATVWTMERNFEPKKHVEL